MARPNFRYTLMEFGNERGGNERNIILERVGTSGAGTSGMQFWNELEKPGFLQALLSQVRHKVIRQPVLWHFGAPEKVRLLST